MARFAWHGIAALIGDAGIDEVTLIDQAAETLQRLSGLCREKSGALRAAVVVAPVVTSDGSSLDSVVTTASPGPAILGASNAPTPAAKLLCSSNPEGGPEKPAPGPEPEGPARVPHPATPISTVPGAGAPTAETAPALVVAPVPGPGALPGSPAAKRKKLQIVDFGCGKAYLTFALYHFLTVMHGIQLEIHGLDLKLEVIAECQTLARTLQYHGLNFSVGDINLYTPGTKVDMMITLHACDTATDAALEKAIRWQTEVILCVPCCQHELFRQVQSASLKPLMRYGILKERFAALATDAARAQLLDILGYQTQVLEFIDLEHTPKNLLIRALKKKIAQPALQAVQDYYAFKKSLQIEPSLEKRFQKELQAMLSG